MKPKTSDANNGLLRRELDCALKTLYVLQLIYNTYLRYEIAEHWFGNCKETTKWTTRNSCRFFLLYLYYCFVSFSKWYCLTKCFLFLFFIHSLKLYTKYNVRDSSLINFYTLNGRMRFALFIFFVLLLLFLFLLWLCAISQQFYSNFHLNTWNLIQKANQIDMEWHFLFKLHHYISVLFVPVSYQQ